jgi:hypothetical protein
MPLRVVKNAHDVSINPIKYKLDTEFDKIIPPLPSQTFFIICCGKPRSGKSTTMASLLSKRPNKDGYGFYRKKFDHIFFIMPKNSLSNIPDKHPYHKHIKAEPDSYYDTLNGGTLHEIMDRSKADALEGEKSLIIIDDELAALKNPEVVNALSEIASNRRHYGLSVVILTQVWNSVPLTIRKMISHAFIWRCGPREFENVFEECFFTMKREDAKELCDHAWSEPHGFVFIDLSANKYYDSKLHELIND